MKAIESKIKSIATIKEFYDLTTSHLLRPELVQDQLIVIDFFLYYGGSMLIAAYRNHRENNQTFKMLTGDHIVFQQEKGDLELDEVMHELKLLIHNGLVLRGTVKRINFMHYQGHFPFAA